MFIRSAAQVQKQAAHPGTVAEVIAILVGVIGRGIQLQPATHLKAEIVTLERQAATVAGGDDSAFASAFVSTGLQLVLQCFNAPLQRCGVGITRSPGWQCSRQRRE